MLSVVGVTLRPNANIASQCAYHLVWCPKYGGRVRGGRMQARLKEVIAEVIEEKAWSWRLCQIMCTYGWRWIRSSRCTG
jgi:putative transposase